MKILIIEDEIDFANLLKRKLSKLGCEIHITSKLADGLEALNSQHQVLIIDDKLPDGMGWQQVQSIKNHFPNLNIFMVSAHWQRQEEEAPKCIITAEGRLQATLPIHQKFNKPDDISCLLTTCDALIKHN